MNAYGTILDRPPPAAMDCERGLCAAGILDGSILPTVANEVSAGDFLDSDLAGLFVTLQMMWDAGLPTSDAAILVAELRRLGLYKTIGGGAAIYKLMADGMVHPPHALHYARQIRKAAELRRTIGIATEWLQRAYAHNADPAENAMWLDAQLAAIGQNVAEPSRSIREIAAEIIADLKQPEARGRALMTGLSTLDETVGGWMPGELIILAARPGLGKTTLALQVAAYNAEGERPALFVSLEMKDRELIQRWLCGLAGVNSRRLRTGRYDAGDVAAMERAVPVADVPLRIWAPAVATLAQIRAVAKRDHAAGKLALLVVDYIGLVRPEDPKRQRQEQVAAVSAGLKAISKELSVPVLALCQLNREADGEEPRLSHLRESGAIEQDADIVLFVHRQRQDETEVKLIVAKHRHGDTGAVSLRWEAARTRFNNIGEDFGEYTG